MLASGTNSHACSHLPSRCVSSAIPAVRARLWCELECIPRGPPARSRRVRTFEIPGVINFRHKPTAGILAEPTRSLLCGNCAKSLCSSPYPTRSRGMRRRSPPYLRNTSQAVCAGLMPTPSLVMSALVASFCLNSLHTNFNTAVNGASSGTFMVLKGSFGSEVSVILNETCEVVCKVAHCIQ